MKDYIFHNFDGITEVFGDHDNRFLLNSKINNVLVMVIV